MLFTRAVHYKGTFHQSKLSARAGRKATELESQGGPEPPTSSRFGLSKPGCRGVNSLSLAKIIGMSAVRFFFTLFFPRLSMRR